MVTPNAEVLSSWDFAGAMAELEMSALMGTCQLPPRPETSLTIEGVENAIRSVQRVGGGELFNWGSFGRPMFNGMPIVEDFRCFIDSEVRTFPESRHRSARIKKKLVKRFGGEFMKVPGIIQAFGGLVVHPSIYAQMKVH